MQVKIFTIPLFDNEAPVNELNAFLRSQKILTVDKQFVAQGDTAFWSVCVTFLPQTNSGSLSLNSNKAVKIDYKEVLDEHTFTIFSKLRSIRKQMAEQEAVPAYAIFTESELAEIAKLETIDPIMMQTISGIGVKRAEKYGKTMSELFKQSSGMEGA